MKKYKDIFGNEITDPFYLNIRQRLDVLKKRNTGRKHFSKEDRKELDTISEELDKYWKILKDEIDKIPILEQVRRIKINVSKIRPGLFDTSIFDKKRLFDKSIFDKRTEYKNRFRRNTQCEERY